MRPARTAVTCRQSCDHADCSVDSQTHFTTSSWPFSSVSPERISRR